MLLNARGGVIKEPEGKQISYPLIIIVDKISGLPEKIKEILHRHIKMINIHSKNEKEYYEIVFQYFSEIDRYDGLLRLQKANLDFEFTSNIDTAKLDIL